MPERGWKQFERRVAAWLGGKRRGADTGGNGNGGGKTDVIHPDYAIECKLLSRPAWCHMLEAVRQAEKNGEVGQIPIAVVKKVRAVDVDTLVLMRMNTFLHMKDRLDGLRQAAEPDPV